MDGERYSDSLWFKRLLSLPALLALAVSEDLTVLVPQSSSLVSSLISASDVENHILRPTDVKGEFMTLKGNRVHISGSQVVAGEGFARQIAAKLLSIESATVAVPAKQLALIQEAKEKSAKASAAAAAAALANEGAGAGAEAETKEGSSSAPSSSDDETTTVSSSSSGDSTGASSVGGGSASLSVVAAASSPSLAAMKRPPQLPPPSLSPFLLGGSRENGGLAGKSPAASLSNIDCKLRVYFISRPLDKGIPAPSGVDDLDHGSILRLIAMLRASPETEAVFHSLDKAIERASLQLRMAYSSGAASSETSTRDFFFDFVLPPITNALLAACRSAADALLTTGPFAQQRAGGASSVGGSSIGGGVLTSTATTRKQLLQMLESHCMEKLYTVAFPIVEQAVKKDTDELRYVLRKMKGMTQEQLGVKETFRSPRLESLVGLLGLLNNSVTPLEKLHCFRDTTMTMMRCIESELEKKAALAASMGGKAKSMEDVDLATDDILDILLWILVEGGGSSDAADDHATWKLPAHLEYCQAFHFVSSDLREEASRLDYFAGNFWQVLGFFSGKADEYRAQEAKEAKEAKEKAEKEKFERDTKEREERAEKAAAEKLQLLELEEKKAAPPAAAPAATAGHGAAE